MHGTQFKLRQALFPSRKLHHTNNIRTSLDDFLTQNGISSETTLGVEYIKALIPPLYVASYEHDDWVSSVDVLSSTSQSGRNAANDVEGIIQNKLLSGSYDSLLRIWNMSSEVIATGSGHTAAVKAAKFISSTRVVSSGKYLPNKPVLHIHP